MGHRLSKIYTRTGDAGTTGLGDGKRVPKNSLRIHSLGEVDETNSVIGLLLAEELPEDVRTLLTGVQHDLFDLGGEVCIPGMTMITSRQVEYLETELDRLNEPLVPLALAEAVNDAPRQYLNRLSDLLFVLGRVLNRAAGRDDVLWQKGKNASPRNDPRHDPFRLAWARRCGLACRRRRPRREGRLGPRHRPGPESHRRLHAAFQQVRRGPHRRRLSRGRRRRGA